MLTARGLVAAPPGVAPVLSPVDFMLRRGGWVSLGGANGSGKSTLLAALAGLLEPRAGVVTLDGTRLTLDTPARAHVGIVFQEPDVHFLTPRPDTEIAFPLESLGWPRPAIEERVRDLAARFDLAPLLARDLETLSGGERARVAFAVALAAMPEFLLLDEPGNYLDAPRRARLREWVAGEVARGTGVLWATQLQEERAAARRWLRLANGRLEEVAEIESDYPEWGSLEAVSLAPSEAGKGRLVLSARRVSHSVGCGSSRRPLLAGAELDAHAGEALLLEGESGSGKSTLLALLSGLIVPDEGAIEVAAGADLPHDASARFGVLLQSPEDQLVGTTVFEDLLLGGTIGESPSRLANLRVALEAVGLDAERVGHVPPGSLSHGERRRVAWAGLLLLNASVWILDEPTAGVDDEGVGRLRNLVESHTSRGGTAVIAHQDPRLQTWSGRRLAIGAQRLVEPNSIPNSCDSN